MYEDVLIKLYCIVLRYTLTKAAPRAAMNVRALHEDRQTGHMKHLVYRLVKSVDIDECPNSVAVQKSSGL